MYNYDLTIIILNYNGSLDTIECIQSLRKSNTILKYQTIILDNASKKDEVELLVKFGNEAQFKISPLKGMEQKILNERNIIILSDNNFGFAKGNNLITKLILDSSKYILLLNNDTVVSDDFLETCIEFLSTNNGIDFASCRINNYYYKNNLWNCGGKLKFWGNRHYYTEAELRRKGDIVEATFITGCALFLTSSILKKHGLFSEDFFFGEEDFNFCWRMKKEGVKGACINRTMVWHKISQSSSKSGELVGKLAGYYLNRIIDMRKFYPYFIWKIWKKFVKMYIRIYVFKKTKSCKNVKKIILLINQYENNDRLTREDFLNIKFI